jgi:alkylation response protein AidB-like acyl-CoA dehydrogenase
LFPPSEVVRKSPARKNISFAPRAVSPYRQPRMATFPELDAIRALAPEISSRSREFESVRRLPADLARKLAEAGVFRMAMAKAYGGAERNPADGVRVIEEVSRADASVGWCVMIGSTTAMLSGYLPEKSAREIYGMDPMVISGGAVAPSGKAVATKDGYLVNGRWQWGSATQNCNWICGGSIVMEGDQVRRYPTGDPEIRLMLFPSSDVEILDTWDSSGLRGTGSHDFQVKNAFVPNDRTMAIGVTPPVIKTPLYRFPFFGLLAIGVCGVSLGIARRAIDEFIALANKKTPTWERKPLAQSPRIQEAVAEAEAALRSSRAYLFEAIATASDAAEAGESPSMDMRRDLRLAAASVAWQSVKAVDLMYSMGGGSVVHSSHPLQRCLRDVHVVTQHVMVNRGVFEATGKLYLGLTPDSFFL